MIKIATNLLNMLQKSAYLGRAGQAPAPARTPLFSDAPASSANNGSTPAPRPRPEAAPQAPARTPAPRVPQAPARTPAPRVPAQAPARAPAPQAPQAPARAPAPQAPQAPAQVGTSGWAPPEGALVGRSPDGRQFYIDPATRKAVYSDGGTRASRQPAQEQPRSTFNYVNPNSPEGRLAGLQPPQQNRYVNPNSPEGRLVRDNVLDADALRRGETRYRTDSNSAYATDPVTGGFTQQGAAQFRDEHMAQLLVDRERQYQQMAAQDRATNTRYDWDKYRGDSQWDEYSNPNPTSLSAADRARLDRYNRTSGNPPLFR